MTKKQHHYPKSSSKPNFPNIEQNIIKFWEENDIYKKSLDSRKGGDKFTFLDGPPTANGKPHHGHIGISSMKDCICRFRTMQGQNVPLQFGWDCHGLPVEIEVCKDRNLKNVNDILNLGLDKFTDDCRTDVMKYKNIWTEAMQRIGRFGNYSNEYHTMDKNYMESVIWAMKTLYDKGLMYQGYKVMAYSYGAETPLSNAEAKSEYKDVVDDAITVLFKLNEDIDGKETNILAWTTTPWTLPTNLALCVGNDIEYCVMEENGKHYILASALLPKFEKQLSNATLVKTIKGSDLVGKTYEPLFPYFKELANDNAFQIFAGDFVTTTDGTGIVHLAPYGEDDYALLNQYNVKMIFPVNEQGKFSDDVVNYKGLLVFDANKQIIEDLKSQGKLVKKENYKHSYPFCWRTKTPLIYRPMESWFVSVEKIKQQLIDNNQSINWIPDHIKDGRFGKWLEGARDWGISRNRFWSTPLPIWESDNPEFPRRDVFGSIAEIEAASGMTVKDLHRPYIDEVIYPNPDDPSGKTMMKRIPDVVDCWFESGAMPFATLHYPFENKEAFEKNPTADFIVEGQDQTRGWFYTLSVLSTALFGKPAFKNCMVNGMMLDGNKQKLSKSSRNYKEPNEIFSTLGADAFRWFILSSNMFNAQSPMFTEEIVEKQLRTSLIPLHNAYHFFTLYANADGIQAQENYESNDLMDKYILLKLQDLSTTVEKNILTFNVQDSCKLIEGFLEILNNWYIRRSRERFWGTSVSAEAQQEAFNTLYTVLINLCKIMTPIVPFITEYIYRNLTGKESVNLENYPVINCNFNKEILTDMDKVRNICSITKVIREENNLRNRLPLSDITIAGGNTEKIQYLFDIIKDETNIKDIKFADNINDFATKFLYVITPVVGKRLGAFLGQIIPASKKGEYEIKDDKCHIAGQILNADEFEERLEMKSGITGKALSDNTAVIILNTEISDELQAEGIARDAVRAVQDLRKAKDFDISDRITTYLFTEDETVMNAVKNWADYIKEQTLTNEIKFEKTTSATVVSITDKDVNFDVEK